MKTAVFLVLVERLEEKECFSVRMSFPEAGATTETRASSVRLAMSECTDAFIKHFSRTIDQLDERLMSEKERGDRFRKRVEDALRKAWPIPGDAA